jgi:putative chitinase
VLDLATKYKSLLDKYEVNTPLRLAHFFAQVEHESGLKPVQENLNYSAERLIQIFPKYFKTLEQSKTFEHHPQMIANRVYANRMGNGDEASGDGFKYSGKGFIQITGKDNYKALSTATKVDYVTHPEKLLEEPDSMLSALWYWSSKRLNKHADLDDITAITKAINGGLNGLDDRKRLLVKYKELFNEK